MLFLYNTLQLVLLPVFLPLLTVFALCVGKYRRRIPSRLGIGLSSKLTLSQGKSPTFWVHALSVGEVTSALPLVTGLRRSYPKSNIVVSVTTKSGRRVAESLLQGSADCIINGPIDFFPVVIFFVKTIRPDMYILVETDFWPNLLGWLKFRKIPSVLVNGRISDKSMAGYKRFRLFFRPMFASLSCLCMQTGHDRDNMITLGVAEKQVQTLGNLKFDTHAAEANPELQEKRSLLPANRTFFIAGSTHEGEEELLLDCFLKLRRTHPTLYLILAPRDPRRAAEICRTARQQNVIVHLRSDNTQQVSDIFLIDTIGELIDFYALADIAFVGGSLVSKGGHNPIEPSALGIPVFFGPHMEDFREIASTLTVAGGAVQVRDTDDLFLHLEAMLTNPQAAKQCGDAGRKCVQRLRGVVDSHLNLFQTLL